MRQDRMCYKADLQPVRALQGEAGVSCRLLHACVTALACKPVRALQGMPTPQAA